MVHRTFYAFDNDALLVTSSSNGSIVGDGIINNSDTPDGTRFVFQPGFHLRQVIVDDTFQSTTFNDDRPASHTIVSSPLVPAGTQVESESIIFIRALDPLGNPTGPTIRLVVFSQGGVTQNVWGFSTTAHLVPGTAYVKVGGSNNGSSPYTDLAATCFAEGTPIRTPDGPRRIETLAVGDPVWTRTHPARHIAWIGRRTVPAERGLAPVIIGAGALGNPAELVVSQQHRMLIGDWRAELLFGEPELLVPAKALAGLPGISIREGGSVTWMHLMFETHEIVEAGGILSESFQPGSVAIGSLDAFAREELFAIFPELSDPRTVRPDAAPSLSVREGRVLAGELARAG
jgi:hypothetical protein